eukprot:CAMPEP_0170580622 /NCGR_PEP_ID=MMETSP0224-20130122/6606_1 /TAXON_ID=285029 /ORGANISM="Togula jolla, Strain CCCM 725" /LENGTH=64 /DNA_ID=CAMNT_0010903707 /DNA_START=521 /DNA_END=712 /DNA_ORIENTATION=+
MSSRVDGREGGGPEECFKGGPSAPSSGASAARHDRVSGETSSSSLLDAAAAPAGAQAEAAAEAA